MRNVVHAKDVAESSFALDFSFASYCSLSLYIPIICSAHPIWPTLDTISKPASVPTNDECIRSAGRPLVTHEDSSPRRDFHNPIYPSSEIPSAPQCRPTEIDWRDSLPHLLGWSLPTQHPLVGQSPSNLRTKGCYRLHVLLVDRILILIE